MAAARALNEKYAFKVLRVRIPEGADLSWIGNFFVGSGSNETEPSQAKI
jgi:ABC-type transporter MlaC component